MNKPYNTGLLWTNPTIEEVDVSWIFSFDGWKLDNGSTIRVTSSNHDDVGTIDYSTYKTPLEDGGGVLGKYYRTKTINIWLSIKGETKEELNNLIDEIKYRTSKTEWILRIEINGELRERTATCINLKFNREYYNINWCGKVDLTFSCVNPHSKYETPIIEDFIGQTGTYTKGVLYDGRAESFPTLHITIDSGTAEWISFSLNGYTLEVEQNLSAWDIIVFDGEKKSVKLNWIEVEYTWPFVSLTYGENIISIDSDATYSWTLSFYKKFI